MGEELMFYNYLDPEVLLAQSNAIKLFEQYWMCTDPLTKKALKSMVFDALEYEAELRLKSKVREAVKTLHDLQNPKINPN